MVRYIEKQYYYEVNSIQEENQKKEAIKREQALRKTLEAEERKREFDRISEENRIQNLKKEEENEEKRKMVIRKVI